MSKARILIVDNRRDHIAFRREELEREGYEVREAYGPEGAWKELETGLIHLAIVDIRLIDDDDEHDWSGLDWVEDVHDQYPEFPCVMLTGYPSFEAVQRARTPDDKGLPPADHFVSKHEELEELVKAVNNAIANKVKINPCLDIEFGGPLSCVCIANIIEFRREGILDEDETRRLLLKSQEIRNLLCKMFFDCERIVVYPLLAGRSKAAVLAVRPFSGGRAERLVVAKLGKREDIEREALNYYKHAARLPGTWVPTMKAHTGGGEEPTAKTLHFGGLVYTVAAGEFERTERFRDFYRTNDADRIIEILGGILRDMRTGWYPPFHRDDGETLSAAFRRELELTDEHHSRESFVDALSQLCGDASDFGPAFAVQNGRLDIDFRGGHSEIYPNPTAYVYDCILDFGPALKCVTHGDFNGDNLLVDQQHKRVWLIDFARTGEGSALRDFAELESVIKFELVGETDLQRLHRFEQRLLSCADLEHTPEPDPDMPPDLRKAMLVTGALRKHVSGIASQADYFASLLFHAAWMVVSEGSSPPTVGQARSVTVRKSHALLSAAMLCDWLKRGGPRPVGVTANVEVVRPTIAAGTAHLPDAPTVARIRLSNYSAEPRTATVSCRIDRISEPTAQTVELGPYENKAHDYSPLLAPTGIRGIREERSADLHIRVARIVDGSEHVILQQPIKVHLLPRNVILWAIRDPYGQVHDLSHHIGAWVTPEAEAIAELQRGILDKHPDRQMVGYQGGDTSEEREAIVREQIRAIYNYLKHVQNMAYADTSISFGRISLKPGEAVVAQVVRLPHETVGANRGTANCIDATVLFASLIARFGINPVIVLVPGHAFLGWQTWPGSPRYEYLETTVIARADFDDSVKLGSRRHEQATQEGLFEQDLSHVEGYAVEHPVWRLREQGIQAMPLEGE